MMRMFPFVHKQKLRPSWRYESEGIIWRLLISGNGSIVGESRNQDKKSASFFCIDEKAGTVHWERVSLEEPWWVGIEAVHREVLFLHEFTKPDMPEHRKILAVDLKSGKLLWRNEELTFWFASEEKVYAYKSLFEKRVGYALDLQTGEILEEITEETDDLSRSRIAGGGQDSDFVFPEIFEESSAAPRVGRLITKEIGKSKVAGNIEYIHHGEYVVLNYYTADKNSANDVALLKNTLSIMEVDSGEHVFLEILNRGVQAPVPDSFFVKGEFAFFIKDQRTLSALRLWKS